jgi:CubicO group peptidase (beta-lactamase class C family)
MRRSEARPPFSRTVSHEATITPLRAPTTPVAATATVLDRASGVCCHAVMAPTNPVEPDVAYATQNLRTNVATARSKTGVPAIAFAVVSPVKGYESVSEGHGVLGGGSPGKVTADTVFQLASLSKPITTTIIAADIAAYRKDPIHTDWNNPLSDLDPDLVLADPRVTIGALLAHRSGLPEHAGDRLEDMGYSGPEVLRRLRRLSLSPGRLEDGGRFSSAYAYTNFGFTAAAVAVAARRGTDWVKLASSVLHDRLKMNSTSVRFDDFKERLKAHSAAWPHVRTPPPGPGVPAFPGDARWISPDKLRDADAQAPAGGVSSSASDLALWMKVQLGLSGSSSKPGPRDFATTGLPAGCHV